MKRLHFLLILTTLTFSLLLTACEDEKIEITARPGASKPTPVEKKTPENNKQPTNPQDTKTPDNPNVKVVDPEYPLKDVVVPAEIRAEIEEMLPKINTTDTNVGVNTRQHISNLKEVGQKVLIDIVSDKNNPLRIYASAILGMYCEPNYVPYLKRLIASNEENEIVLQNLLQCLGSYAFKSRGINIIYDIYQKTNSLKTKKNIIIFFRSLCNVNAYPILYAATTNENSEMRLEAVTTLGRLKWHSSFDDKQIEDFLERIANVMRNDKVEEVRNAALDAFVTIQNKKASKYLVEFIKNKENSYIFREKALKELATREDNRFNDVVIDQLSDPNWRIRWQSAVTLGLLEESKSIPKLIQLYREDPIYKVRVQTFVSMGRMIDDRVKKVLTENIDNPNKDFAHPAIMGTAYQGVTSAIDEIAKRLEDKDPDVRSAAFLAVVKLSFDLKTYKYLARLKEVLANEKVEGLKEYHAWMLGNFENQMKEQVQTKENKPQTQENKETENQTQENKK